MLGRFGVREITEQDLAESTPLLFADVRRKAFDLYEAKQRAANQFLINEMITAEAAERGMTDQQLWDLEVRDRVPVPSEEEIQSFFEINQQYARGRTIDQLRSTIIKEIQRPQQVRAQQRFVRQLREKYGAEVLVEPIRIDYLLPESAKSKGNDDAPVTLVEFADFQCPSCKNAHPMVEQLLTEYGDKIRYVFVDFPLANHQRAVPASIAARCADEQGMFWEFSDNLMVIAGNFADSDLYDRAAKLGLDADLFATCYQSGKYEELITAHQSWGQSLGVGATPTFLINDRLQVGSKPFEEMKQMIDKEIARVEQG